MAPGLSDPVHAAVSRPPQTVGETQVTSGPRSTSIGKQATLSIRARDSPYRETARMALEPWPVEAALRGQAKANPTPFMFLLGKVLLMQIAVTRKIPFKSLS